MNQKPLILLGGDGHYKSVKSPNRAKQMLEKIAE